MKTIQRLLLISLMAAATYATSLFELESKYLGNGWFQYRVKTLSDPAFRSVDLTSFGVPFTNRIAYGTNTVPWTSDASPANRADWIFDSFTSQAQPYEITFLARSSETNFRTVNAKVLGYSFIYNNGLPNSEDLNGVGVADFPVLVPCPPNQA